ncbi:hypothetical protein [Salinigranum marinum]|uniref:hypothetical protein n=1 Tax=Salinigranum marinum TaxID=1515595 RepID=UPI002989CB2C|nr:hypothetical protein [Salinigranum marinum]
MSLSRRALLGVSVSLLAGCGSRPGFGLSPPGPSTPRRSPTAGDGATTIGRPDDDPEESVQAVGAVTVANDADADRYVTVVVESEAGSAFVESRSVRRGTAVTFDGVVPATGTYRVVVDTAAGPRGTFDWPVTSQLPALRARLTDEVSFSRPAACDPDCGGVALGGTATGYPAGGFDPRGRRAGSELRVHNADAVPTVVRVRVADGAVLDYRYRLPPAVTLVVPVPQRAGETAVRVDVDGGDTRRFRWAMETNPVRRVTVDGAG